MPRTTSECDQLMLQCIADRDAADLAGDEQAVTALGHALDALLDERIHLPAQRTA